MLMIFLFIPPPRIRMIPEMVVEIRRESNWDPEQIFEIFFSGKPTDLLEALAMVAKYLLMHLKYIYYAVLPLFMIL